MVIKKSFIKNFIRVLICLFFAQTTFAGNIKKAFQSLSVYNYFDAQNRFLKLMDKNPAVGAFGLSIIYSRNDNPFYNLEKAYQYLISAEQDYYQLSIKQQKSLRDFNFTIPALDSLKDVLATNYFDRVVQSHLSETVIERYIYLYPWSKNKKEAIHLRDSIAYEYAVHTNQSADFLYFTKKYPHSEWFSVAKAKYYLLQYQEETKGGTIDEYLTFLMNFPKNPYIEEAQDQIYKLFISDKTKEEYYMFTQKFPKNRNVNDAWRKVYQIFMYDYTTNQFDEFIRKYPDYPYLNEVVKDKNLAMQDFYPFQKKGMMGWMNADGIPFYPLEYETVGFFKEGLASVSLRGKFGFVDKNDSLIIPIIYDGVGDFNNGRAAVEVNDKYGIVDRTGRLVFDTIYSDIGDFSEDKIYAKLNGKYHYYDRFGTLLFEEGFDDVLPFEGQKASVYLNGKQTFINERGEFLLPPVYEEMRILTDSLFIVSDGSNYGLVNLKKDTILPFIYDEIGNLSDGYAIVSDGEKFGYIDRSGKWKIPLKYEEYPNYLSESQFKNGIAKVKLKGKFGAVDANDIALFPITYTELGDVHSKWIAFTKGKLWGFLNEKNKVVISPRYESATSFANGRSVVSELTQYGVIDEKQNWIIPARYSSVRLFENQFWIANDGARMFLYDFQGNLISKNHFQQIRKVSEDLILLQNADGLSYYSLKDKKLIVLSESSTQN